MAAVRRASLVCGLAVLVAIVVAVAAHVPLQGRGGEILAQYATATYQPTSTMPPTPVGGVPTALVTAPWAAITLEPGFMDATATEQPGNTSPPPLVSTPTP